MIVGGGYAGLSGAIEPAGSGIDACVLEAAEFGAGASTRSGGGISGGVNIGKLHGQGAHPPITPDFPLYNGSAAWALPAVGAYYRFRDNLSRALAP